MVANRGFHNPSLGSFSFFEEVLGTSQHLNKTLAAGEFFFGHFTKAENGIIVADQQPNKGQLLIELIAWDTTKMLFNFYELIGTGGSAQWFYRGDSEDILADNALLYLNGGTPKFGSRLRCSACHSSGGPIMKELTAPFNDWWTRTRPLAFGSNVPSSDIAMWLSQVGDASQLSDSVKAGIHRLEESDIYQKAKRNLSFKANLRPLFCETEINLESDLTPLMRDNREIIVPSAFVVNPLLAQENLKIPLYSYTQLLDLFGMQFPEITRQDADHAWLVPVKGYSDLLAIKKLIKDQIVDDEFVADVLAVDMAQPLLSTKRCGLVQLVPNDGLQNFAVQLKASSLPEAQELYKNLTDPSRSKQFHQARVKDSLRLAQSDLLSPTGQHRLFKKLIDDRQAVFDSEISKNPRGQILEPGFRVIFPKHKQH